jgi:hypothetical protein
VAKGLSLLGVKPPVWDPAAGSIDLVYWYWGLQAAFHAGGTTWQRWQKTLAPEIGARARTDGNLCTVLGSFDPIDPWSAEGGRVYSTALATLCLETPWRYPRLPPAIR